MLFSCTLSTCFWIAVCSKQLSFWIAVVQHLATVTEEEKKMSSFPRLACCSESNRLHWTNTRIYFSEQSSIPSSNETHGAWSMHELFSIPRTEHTHNTYTLNQQPPAPYIRRALGWSFTAIVRQQIRMKLASWEPGHSVSGDRHEISHISSPKVTGHLRDHDEAGFRSISTWWIVHCMPSSFFTISWYCLAITSKCGSTPWYSRSRETASL